MITLTDTPDPAKTPHMPRILLSDRSPVSIAVGGMIAMAVSIGIGRFVYAPILAATGLTKSAAGLIAAAKTHGG